MVIVVVVLLIGIVVYGGIEMSQSYASAQQAQAQIEQAQAIQEVARQGQINAAGNLVTVLTFMLIIVILIALVLFVLYRWSRQSARRYSGMPPISAPKEQPRISMDDLIRVMLLRELRSMGLPGQSSIQSPSQNVLDVPKDDSGDPLHWLR